MTNLFNDQNFDRSLPTNAPLNIKWKRLRDLYDPCYYIVDLCNCDLKQSTLGDCFILAPVDAILARAMRDIRVLHEFLRVVGAWQNFSNFTYTGKFVFDFKSTRIEIDDYIPTVNNRPLYCYNKSQHNEVWPCLLEKAFAKLYGSYRDLNAGGDPLLVLAEFFKEGSQIREVPLIELNIKQLLIEHDIIATCFIYDQNETYEAVYSNNLVNKHAYSILARDEFKVTLKNPWRNYFEHNQQSPPLAWCQHLNKYTDGIFNITWEQLCLDFTQLVGFDPYLPDPLWYSRIVLQKVYWLKCVIIFENPVKKIKIKFKTTNTHSYWFDYKFKHSLKWIGFEIRHQWLNQIKIVEPASRCIFFISH